MPATTTSRPGLRGLVLRPGTHVLRRGAAELQVGLDPHRAVVLPDTPRVRSLLGALRNPAAVLEDHDEGVLGLLADSDLLLDAGPLLPLVTTRPDAEVPRPSVAGTDVAAVAALVGDRAPGHLAARHDAVVEVVPCGSAEAGRVAHRLLELLATAGVGGRLLPHGEAAPSIPASSTPGAAAVVVCVGEPPRELLDPWMRAGTPHLLLRLTEGSAVIGPFVVPGETACLRCVDAHHTDHDPAWPLLVTQYASAVTRAREDTVPEPVDSLLATLAGAWAARELVTYVEGLTPATTAATVRLDPRLTALETHAWPRHPSCGCAWA